MASESEYEHDGSDVDSFASLEEEINIMSHYISDLYSHAEELEEHLSQLHKPIENLELKQLGDAPFLKSSPFRHATFAVKPPGFPGADLTKRYSFSEICQILRSYLFASNLIQSDGTVTLNEPLKTLFDTQEPHVQYIELLGKLKNVLI